MTDTTTTETTPKATNPKPAPTVTSLPPMQLGGASKYAGRSITGLAQNAAANAAAANGKSKVQRMAVVLAAKAGSGVAGAQAYATKHGAGPINWGLLLRQGFCTLG